MADEPSFTPIADPNDAWDAIYDYRVGGQPPEAIAAWIDEFLKMSSVSMAAGRTVELAFAWRETAPAAFLTLAARVSTYCTMYGVIDGDRGKAISAALQRDAGVEPLPGLPWPDAADDPDPHPEFDPANAVADEAG